MLAPPPPPCSPPRRAPRAGAGVAMGVALAAGWTPLAEATPAGRVVRVERPRAGTPPRFCAMSADEPSCFGRPRAGEHIALIDVDVGAIVGDFVIDGVGEHEAPLGGGLCVSSGAYTVQGRPGRDNLEAAGEQIGLRGLTLGKQARVLSNSIAGPDTLQLTLDTDGDRRADLMVSRFPCDATGAPDPDATGRCVDIQIVEGKTLRRTSRDILRACY